MKSQLSTLRNQFRQQADKAPWLRWAALGIAVLIALLLLQSLETVRVEAAKQAMDEELKLRKMRSLRGQDVWLQREQDTAALLAGLDAQIPDASTSGVAQAGVQSWLQELTNATSDPSRIRIALEGATPLEDVPGLLRIRASLRGGMTPREALAMIRRIETATNLVVIESLDIRSDSNSTTSIAISAYYRITAPAQGSTP